MACDCNNSTSLPVTDICVNCPPGPSGAVGATGANGAAGADGSTWLNGSGAPSSGLGSNDDYYIDNDNSNYYLKVAGSWVLQGALGSNTSKNIMMFTADLDFTGSYASPGITATPIYISIQDSNSPVFQAPTVDALGTIAEATLNEFHVYNFMSVPSAQCKVFLSDYGVIRPVGVTNPTKYEQSSPLSIGVAVPTNELRARLTDVFVGASGEFKFTLIFEDTGTPMTYGMLARDYSTIRVNILITE